jgi:hypothetical protein
MSICEKFEYSRHCEDRLKERQIQKEYIRSAFRSGCSCAKLGDGSYKNFSTLRGRTLIVIVKVIKDKRCFVLTAYWGAASLN